MKVVGLVSAYKEGRLVAGAIRSLERVGLDDLLVYEGPAGEPIEDAPTSMYDRGFAMQVGSNMVEVTPPPYQVTEGNWRSDARKRDAMLQEAKRRHPDGPLWGVWLDGDEILCNGEYLRDILQALVWQDEQERSENPWMRWPLRLVEADGAIATISNRVVRLDLIRSYEISTSVVTDTNGVERAWGNVAEDSRVWMDHFIGALDRGRMTAWPPLPCEPHIVHRSHLRHPLRRGVRMHAQEAEELRRAGKI